MRLQLLGLLLGLLSFVSALSAQGNKLLVIIDDESEKSRYSQLWTDLQARGFTLTYSSPKETSLSLFSHGVPAYSHLLLLPTKSKALGPALTPNLLVDFINAGSNILLTLSAEQAVPSAISSLLLELDISLSPDRNSLVVDHFNYDSKSSGEGHDVLLLPSPEQKGKGVKNYFSVDGKESLIAFPRTVGQVLGNASPLLNSIVKAPATAYTYNPKEDSAESALEDVFATGSQLSLVTAFQARNSARFTVLGSVESLEDKWLDASAQLPGSKQAVKVQNRAFAKLLTGWTFKELGVLRTSNINHYLNEPPPPIKGSVVTGTNETTAVGMSGDLHPLYRIKNNVRYEIEMSEWDGEKWVPFEPPHGDEVQLEFSMLSPFWRLPLKAERRTEEATVLTQEFKLPDQHGIFNFFVEYRRPFYTNIEEKDTVTVRHFAHNEWPRSFVISGAWPWISGIWMTIGGWVLFVALWLYSKPAQPKRELKASEKR